MFHLLLKQKVFSSLLFTFIFLLSNSYLIGQTQSFTPDPNKIYYLDVPQHDLRLAATGQSQDAFTTSTNTTGPDVEWRFVAKGNGFWHLRRAAGGALPGLRTDNTANADMQETSSVGVYTYYRFDNGNTSGTHYLTLPDGPANFQRLQMTPDGEILFTTTAFGGDWVSWLITEVNNNTPSDCEVDLSSATPELITNQGTTIATINAANAQITINGNGWNALNIPHSLNPNSILEFEFASTQQGEEHGIGFSNAINSGNSTTGTRYKLFGTQNVPTAQANQDFNYTGNGDFQSFSIPVGQLLTGDFQYIVFINDNDANPTQGHSSFRNIKIADAGSSCFANPVDPIDPSVCEVDLSSATPELISNQGTAIGTINAANNQITINGNGWNALNILHSLNPNSILEFEFASTQQGEEHGIGFSNAINSGNFTTGTRYKLFGTQNVPTAQANQDFNYTGNGDFQSFSIPVGQLITGDFQYIVFINDNDANPAEGHSSFRNIRIADAGSSCLDDSGSTPTNPSAINFAFNFATENTVTPNGFIEDIGSPYGVKGSLTYGWRLVSNNAPTSVENRARNRAPAVDADPIRETFIHMNHSGTAPAAKWEIDIPNGTYRVVVQVGDPDNETTVGTQHLITAEGVTLVDFSPGSGFGTRTAVAEVSVTDGAFTLDGSAGLNAKINSVVIQSADGLRFPAVVGAVPLDGATDVSLNTSISANFISQPNANNAGLTSLDNTSINNNTVKLFRLDGAVATPVAITVNGTGGGDAINISVATTLEANTRYRYQINGVTDLAGATIFPYTAEFITGEMSAPTDTGNLEDVSFSNLGSVANGLYASLTMGPDGKLYGLNISGEIDRWTINANGTLSGKETLNGLVNAFGAQRLSIGLTFAPNSTANNLVAYVTHSTFVFNEGPIYDGKMSRLSGNNLQNEATILTGLPRSIRDHLSNSIVFDPNNPNVLYFNQGSNSAGGAPDGSWGFRPERLLTAATLRLNLNLLPNNLPLNVRTSDNVGVINAASTTSLTMSDGTYNPYANNAPLTIFASGLRNPYDLVWHSNGQLYVPTNGTAGGSNSPASAQGTRRADGSFYNGPTIPAVNGNSAQDDFLFRIDPNSSVGYYGHPNPLRGEYVLNSGSATSTTYPNGVVADANYRGFAFNFELNKSPNGVIEYKFPGALQGALIVCRYSGGSDLITLIPDGPNGDISTSLVGLTGFSGLNDPLDLVEDTNTGNIYVSDFATSEIILLRLDNPGDRPSNSGLTINPGQLNFQGNINQNIPSQDVLLSNLTTEALTINSINIDGTDAAKFSISGAAGSITLQPGNAATITVDYTTGATVGNFSASLAITLSDGTIQRVNLNGSTNSQIENGITVLFTAPENNDVYLQGEDFQVDVLATADNGSISNVRLFLDGILVRQENFAPYNWAAAGQPEDFSTLAPGSYTFTAIATDNMGNTQESSINVSVLQERLAPAIFVENMRKVPGTNEAFPYNDRIVFHTLGRLPGGRMELSSDVSTVRINNTGTGILTIQSMAISNNLFAFNDYTEGDSFELVPGDFRDVEIEFVETSATGGLTGIRLADLTIFSNDPTNAVTTVELAGGYSPIPEGNVEITAQQVLDVFDFQIQMAGASGLTNAFPTPTSLAAGDHGDQIASQLWEQADPNEPVVMFFNNAFRGPGGSHGRLIREDGAIVDNFNLNPPIEWIQSLFPRGTQDKRAPLLSTVGNIEGEFAIQINGRTSLGFGDINPETGLPSLLSLKVFPIIDRDGNVRPNEYYAMMDFTSSPCVFRGSGTCDFNDSGIYLRNIRPVAPVGTNVPNSTATCINPTNIAIGKATSQSSTFANNNTQFGSANAVDGNRNGNHNNNSITHTVNQQNAWWEIDLGTISELSSVNLWNRTNCCANRLTDFHVLVSDVPFTSTNLNTTINQNGVSDFHFPGTAGRETDINLNRTGRYLRVQLSGTNALQLAEVEIMGCGSAQATIYQDCDFVGNNVSLGIGEYPNMPSIGFTNNDLSSLQVPVGLQVTLFNNTNFGGNFITLTADDNCLANNSFNDLAGSMVIEPINAAARSIERKLYVAPLFGQKTKLEWHVSQENDKKVKQYQIKHSTRENEEMQEVTIIPAEDTEGLIGYDFVHQTPDVGVNYYQVVVQYEDGTENYQLVGDVTFNEKIGAIQISPNPTSGNLFVDLSKYMGRSVYYFVNSIDGMQIHDGKWGVDHEDTVQVDLSDIQNGIYIIYMKPENRRAVALKFVIAKDY